MNALDFISKKEFDEAKALFEKKELFSLGKEIKVKNGRIKISIYAKLLDKETQLDIIDDIRNGEDYLVHVNESHHFPNKIGGFGYAESYSQFKEYFMNFEAFLEFANGLIKKFPDFEEPQLQLNFFEE